MYKPISLFSAILLILVVTSVRADITEVGWIDTPGDAQHVCVADDYAYIADMTGGLRIIDVSDPENPDEVGVYNPGGNTRFMGVFVSGNTAYLCCVNTGFHVVDVSDPERPRLLGSANCPSFAREVKVVGNYAYVPTDSHGLLIYDVSDPEHPQEVGRCATQNGAWGIHVEGNYAYIANCDNGLYIVDISDPENPDVVGSCATRDRTMGIFVRGDYAFMADRNGFCVIDVADPENPDEVGHCQLPSFAADVYVVGEMAFVAVHSDGQRMVVIDVSDPENPDVVTDYRTRHEAFRLTIDGTLAYVAIRYNGLQILDVSDYAINGPIIEVSDEEIDFDEVGLNTTADMHLMIGNVGVEDLVISDITVEGEYFGTDFEDELIIEPDEEYELTVTFSPEERGAFEGNMTIISNDLYEEEPEIALFGEGVGPRISIIPHEMNFGDVGIDLSAELDLVIRNRGLNDLVISSVTNETEFFIFQFDEEVILEPNGRLAIPVTFSPVLGIDYEDTITISCNDPDNETVEVPLSGRGVGALISAEPDIIDFGDIGLARSSDQRLTIRNEGQLDLHVLDIVVEDPYFNVQFDGEFVIEPDRSHNITVTFAPERSGEFEGSLIIGSDDRQNEEFIVPLAGTGVGPRIAVDQDTMRFDMRRVDRSSALLLTITAVGLTDLTVSDVSVDGDYFSIDFDGEVFIELNNRFQVMVTYAPADDGIHEGALTISSDDEDNPQKTVVLTGSAIDGVISDTPGSALSVYVDADFAYVADDEAGLRIINVFNPEAPREVGSYDSDGNCSGVVVADNYAYVADGSGGMLVVDISSPQEPELLAVVETPGEALDVDVAGEYAFVADGESGLRVINIYDPERPIEVASHDTPGFARAVMIVGETAFVADDLHGLRIIDISEPEHPAETGSFDTRGWTHDVFVSGDYAFLADERYGLRIIDVSDAENPSEIGSYDTDENAYGVTIYGDYAYVADGDGGLCIIHIADPENPVLVDTYYAPDCVVDVFISGDYAYTAASESGLLVLDASNYVSVENIVNPPLPTEFSLSVYPNPFNSTTTITYSLPTATEVSLALYNLSGQRVTMIVESFMHPGIHSSILFAADLPSGLYFVKLTASDRVFTQKIILIR